MQTSCEKKTEKNNDDLQFYRKGPIPWMHFHFDPVNQNRWDHEANTYQWINEGHASHLKGFWNDFICLNKIHI